MGNKIPVLIIIPHGGYEIPEELNGVALLNNADTFLEADSCANELFMLEDRVEMSVQTTISRIFVDTDRSHLQFPPRFPDGIIKQRTIRGKEVFPPGVFPDEIALSNIIKRYYLPFHNSLQKVISNGTIRLVLECHTMMAVGPQSAGDAGFPRPLVTITDEVERNGEYSKTAEPQLAPGLAEIMKKFVSSEDATVTDKISINTPAFPGFIMKKYADRTVPWLKLSISRSLFLNETYFNYDYLSVDKLRLHNLREKLWEAISRFYSRYIQ